MTTCGRGGSFSLSPCSLAGQVYQGTGMSCYAGSLGMKACWAQLELTEGPAEHLLGASLMLGLCKVLFLWSIPITL